MLFRSLVIPLKANFYEFEKTIRDEEGLEITDPSGFNREVGSTVNYQLDTTMPALTADTVDATYTFKDTMSTALTFGEDVALTFGTDPTATTYDDFDEINALDGVTLVYNTNGFELTIDYLVIDDYAAGADVVVNYSAVINNEALTELGDPLDNAATLLYPNDPSGEGITRIVPVYTYGFDFDKVDGAGDALIGAEFGLYAGTEPTDTSVPMSFLFDDDANAWYPVPAGTTGAVTTITSTTNNFNFAGLDEGTYYLKETQAPSSGYNLLAGFVKIIITGIRDAEGDLTAGYTVQYGEKVEGEYVMVTSNTHSFSVVNSSRTELPSTGGMGTTLFAILGLGIILGGCVLLFVNRKRVFGK